MPLNSMGVYVSEHKVWDHVGNIIPDVEHSEGERPAGEFKPAAWLPVQFFDKYHEEYYTVMPGKILATDNQGRLVPAQYGLGSAQVTYTDRDVEAGVIDVRTGAALLSGATGTFNVSSVSDFMGTGEAMAVSKPVGVCPYGFLQWAGDGSALDDGWNPVAYRKHNFNMQHQVALLCDYVLQLPLVPAAETSGVEISEDSFANNVSVLKGTFTGKLPIAKNTVRTPIAFANNSGSDAATLFVVEKESADEVVASGDWFIDLETGDVSVYAAATLGSDSYDVTFSHYGSAPVGTAVSKYACALGDLKPGDFLICNADSNWVVASGSDTFQDVMGQVLEVEDVLDKDALGKVRTAFNPPIGTDASGSLPAYAGQMDQMPGSATGGVSDKVHYAGAANLVVTINLVSR